MDDRRTQQLVNADTEKRQDAVLDSNFTAAIQTVYLALQEAGYEPYDQLTGYVRTGNARYITKHRNARELVVQMDVDRIKQYLRNC